MWGVSGCPSVITAIVWELLSTSSCTLWASGTSSPELTATTTSTSYGIKLNKVTLTCNIQWVACKSCRCIQSAECVLVFCLPQVKSTTSGHTMTKRPALWAFPTTTARWCTTARRPSTSPPSPPSSPRSPSSWMWLVSGWASVRATLQSSTFSTTAVSRSQAVHRTRSETGYLPGCASVTTLHGFQKILHYKLNCNKSGMIFDL